MASNINNAFFAKMGFFANAILLGALSLPCCVGGQVFRGYSSTGSLELKSRDRSDNEIVKGYYPNGNIQFVASYREGKLDGELKEYYHNGMLKAEIDYDEGKRDGRAKFYYENGMLRCKIYYDDDEERRAKFYNKDGILTTRVDVDRNGIEVRKRNERRIQRAKKQETRDSDSVETEP